MNAVKTFKEQEIPLTFQHSLRFKDICPVWASKFRTGFDEQDMKTLVHDSKYCIVGEAWGYTGRHAGYYVAPLIPFVGCWTCVKLGREMGIRGFAVGARHRDLDPGVRIRPLEVRDRAAQRHALVGLEHRGGVVRTRCMRRRTNDESRRKADTHAMHHRVLHAHCPP